MQCTRIAAGDKGRLPEADHEELRANREMLVMTQRAPRSAKQAKQMHPVFNKDLCC